MWIQNSTSSYAPMLLCVAITMTAQPERNDAVQRTGQGPNGWRRRTTTTPTMYTSATATTPTLTTGANCHCVNAVCVVSGAMSSAGTPAWFQHGAECRNSGHRATAKCPEFLQSPEGDGRQCPCVW